jgi:predicted O-methyltransferase YrrM
MAYRRWVDGKLRVYSIWYSEKNFDYSKFYSKKAILDWFKMDNYRDTQHNLVNDFLIDYIKKNNFKNVVSFGAGSCAMEYLIKEALPDVNVVATELESRMIETVKPLFKELTCVTFDFYKDDVGVLQKKLDINFDFAFFSGSAYAMDDATFVKMFKRLNECGIYNVIDNSGGILFHKRYFGKFLYRLVNAANYVLYEDLKYPMKYIPENRPYGYGRTIPELRKLYRKAGYDIIDEPKIGDIYYVSVLRSKVGVKE